MGERPRYSFFQAGEPAADPSRTASPGPKDFEHNKFSFSGKIQAQSSDLSLFAASKAFYFPLFFNSSQWGSQQNAVSLPAHPRAPKSGGIQGKQTVGSGSSAGVFVNSGPRFDFLFYPFFFFF